MKTNLLDEKIKVAKDYIREKYGENWLKNDWQAGDVAEAMAEFAAEELEKKLPTWIPCKERLPELTEKGYSERVLVCRPNRFSGQIDVLIAIFHKAKPEGQEYGMGDGLGNYPKTYNCYWSVPAIQLLKDITYWMPLPYPKSLPEPPKEKGGIEMEELVLDFVHKDSLTDINVVMELTGLSYEEIRIRYKTVFESPDLGIVILEYKCEEKEE
jgi:hypothetical protein